MASRLASYALHVSGYRLANTLQHVHSLPGMLVRLLSPDPEVARQCLQALQKLWSRLGKLEELAAGHRQARDWGASQKTRGQ